MSRISTRFRNCFIGRHSIKSSVNVSGWSWRLKATRLTEDFGFAEFSARLGERPLLPFGLDERGQLQVQTDSYHLEPKPGWTVVAFVPPEEAET